MEGATKLRGLDETGAQKWHGHAGEIQHELDFTTDEEGLLPGICDLRFFEQHKQLSLPEHDDRCGQSTRSPSRTWPRMCSNPSRNPNGHVLRLTWRPAQRAPSSHRSAAARSPWSYGFPPR